MDVETGLLRLATVIHWIGIVWALGWVGIATTEHHMPGRFFFVAIAAVGYAVFWAVAWIIRGFARKKN